MSTFSTFIYSGGILLLALVLLFIIPKIKDVLKKGNERKRQIVETKNGKNKKIIEERILKTSTKKDLIEAMISPLILVTLLGLFLLFETNVLNFLKGYAIELAPINYVSLFTLVGLIFITKGAILGLGGERKKKLNSFVWLMHGFVLSMVALFYELLNSGHVELFGINFSWLIVLLVIWEVIVLGNIFGNYKKIA